MGVSRDNILNLIGSKKYQSCILTTFSFDFYFFEMKAMKWLRSCGIRNVNVFIDGNYYSELMNQLSGEEMQLSPGYSLYPVFQNSIFHPKIWMLFGEKEGLLIVGSGNLTYSGNGTNDEVWAAFHFDVRSSNNIEIFSAAWQYVSTLTNSVKGTMNEKTTRWILEYSKWVSELPKVSPFQFVNTDKGERIALLYNTPSTSIWNELSKHLNEEEVTEVVTVSPFYDLDGKSLKELESRFPKASIKVVLDEHGLIPSAFKPSQAFAFYDWYEAGISRSQYNKIEGVKSKLHAKFIFFKTKSGKVYCLLGSANVTNAGLGISSFQSANSEVSILIESDKRILNDLGITLDNLVVKDLSSFQINEKPSVYETIIRNNRFPIRLFSAEILMDELAIYGQGTFSTAVEIIVYDGQGRSIYTLPLSNFQPEIKAKLHDIGTKGRYLQMVDGSTKVPVSNRIILSDYLLLAKTHPNPKTEDIEIIQNEIQNGEFGRVLDLLHYALGDESESAEGASLFSHRKETAIPKEEETKPQAIYDLSTYKTIDNSAIDKSILLTSLSLRVLDVLKIIHSKSFELTTQQDISIDEQEQDLGFISGNEENEINKIQVKPHWLLKSERKKLVGYFKALYENHQKLLLKSTQKEPYRPTLTDITRHLIAIELLLEYGGKSEKYNDNQQQYTFQFLPFTDSFENDNVKGCTLNLVGDFLMLSRFGMKQYEFEYTQKRVLELKREALVNSITCILNNAWRENEMHYADTMILNCLHYLGERNAKTIDSDLLVLISDVQKRIEVLKHKTNKLETNANRFINQIVPAFKRVVLSVENRDFDSIAFKGQIIYKSPWGYCYVEQVSNQNDFTLIRPGFFWNEEKEDYLNHQFSEVYVPLNLKLFITLKI